MDKAHPTILIIEDEPALRKALTTKFRLEGFTVLEAKDGMDGLEQATEHHPDLLLLDIIMPRMDGLTMLKKLRADSWGSNVPVIILTNLSEFGSIADAVSEKAFDYLVKSDWKLADVVKMVKQRLQRV